METTIKGKFMVDSYGTLRSVSDPEKSLGDVIANMYERGAIIEVSIAVKDTGVRRARCAERNTYGSRCNDLLDPKTNECPSAHYHEAVETAA